MLVTPLRLGEGEELRGKEREREREERRGGLKRK